MKHSLLALSLSFAAASASAATIDVTRFDDPAPDGCAVDGCSLREAIALANANTDFDTVRLAAGTYTLSPQASGQVTIDIYSPVRIEGATRTTTIIRSTGNGSMLSSLADLTLRRMTMRDGLAIGTSTLTGVAGAVRTNGAHLDVAGVTFTNNVASFSGAVAVANGSAELLGAHFIDNLSFEGAGALSVNSGTASIAASDFHGNEGRTGGAIKADFSTLTISDHTSLRENHALSGGAIASSHEVTLDDTCDVSFNTASGRGGAFFGVGALRLKGVPTAGGSGLLRVEGNTALQGGAFSASGVIDIEHVAADGNEAEFGGALHLDWTHSLSIRDSRFAGNHATQSGGAIYTRGRGRWERVSLESNSADVQGGAAVFANGAIIDAYNLDVFGNTAPDSAAIRNHGLLTLRHATIWDNRAGHAVDAIYQSGVGSTNYANSILAGRCTGTTASISALGKNFRTTSLLGSSCIGTTATSAQLGLKRGLYGNEFEVSGLISSGSVAVDAGASSYCLTDDVRRAARDAKCDVGAFEFGTTAP